MWRKWREKCRFRIVRSKKLASDISSRSCLNLKTQTRKNKRKLPTYHSQVRTSALMSPLGRDIEDTVLKRQNCPPKPCESVTLSKTCIVSNLLHAPVTDTDVAAGGISQTTQTAVVLSQRTESCVQFSETTELSHTVKPQLSTDSDACRVITLFKKSRTVIAAERLDVNGPAGQHTAISQNQATNRNPDERITSKKTMPPLTDASFKTLTKDIHGIPFFFF